MISYKRGGSIEKKSKLINNSFQFHHCLPLFNRLDWISVLRAFSFHSLSFLCYSFITTQQPILQIHGKPHILISIFSLLSFDFLFYNSTVCFLRKKQLYNFCKYFIWFRCSIIEKWNSTVLFTYAAQFRVGFWDLIFKKFPRIGNVLYCLETIKKSFDFQSVMPHAILVIPLAFFLYLYFSIFFCAAQISTYFFISSHPSDSQN